MDFCNLKGKWENEFGSEMEISKLDNETGIFSGTYSSHTGATGTYHLVGLTDTKPNPEVNSQTVSFSVSWRAIDAEPNQGSTWVSGFAGQVQLIDDKYTMKTTYLLQKDTDPNLNWSSTIIDGATFTKSA